MSFVTLRRPDDFHVHFREGKLLQTVAPYTAAHFGRALVMPNTSPPVVSASTLSSYRLEIMMACRTYSFEPLMTFKIYPALSAAELKALKLAGAVAGKFYPLGVTTNSGDGVSDLKAITHILLLMEELDLVLCVHAEQPEVSSLSAERLFLKHFYWLVETFPKLKIVVEHVSTAEGVALVESLPPTVGATITVHHLMLTLDDVINDFLHPHLFCKPIPKTTKDKEALLEAAMSGNSKFFFGSDSAPHDRSKKENHQCAAGIFSAPSALACLAKIFEEADSIAALEPFTSEFGAQFYGLPLNESSIYLEQTDEKVPRTIEKLVPLAAGKSLGWRVADDLSAQRTS